MGAESSIFNTMVGAGLNFLGADYNNANQKALMKQQYEYQQRLMQEQNDFNVQMWNMNNEYNSASNQVQRYIDAGLNPAFMMQGGSNVPATQVSSSNPNIPNAPTPAGNMNGLGDTYLGVLQNSVSEKSLELKDKELDIQNKLVDAQVDSLSASTKGQLIDNAWKDILNAQAYRRMEKEMQEANARIRLAHQQIQESIANMSLTHAKTITEDVMRQPMVADMIASWKKKYSDIGVNEASIREMFYHCLLMNDEHNWNVNYRFKLGDAELQIKGREYRNLGFQGNMLKLDFDRGKWEFSNAKSEHNWRIRYERTERSVHAASEAAGIFFQGMKAYGIYRMGQGGLMPPTSPNSYNPIINANTSYSGSYGVIGR